MEVLFPAIVQVLASKQCTPFMKELEPLADGMVREVHVVPSVVLARTVFPTAIQLVASTQ